MYATLLRAAEHREFLLVLTNRFNQIRCSSYSRSYTLIINIGTRNPLPADNFMKKYETYYENKFYIDPIPTGEEQGYNKVVLILNLD